ncbi:Crp/Fnr family transcriptional regulator [Galbibacter sp. EGI 63066]|uniref:Crp/Fnr family transcriptional regulator n=1 Tax=Galbibacter sp. EGI 63066 TaxID=2993559 RepID=UPI002248BF42|nr:Crp/Fnr family transcriptional regulator [Galbibacter sp. EGI 63066]MCX2680847.1 Crp/Fnr family transcriptional regulator [Galbibacter sp. EGI 63066]
MKEILRAHIEEIVQLTDDEFARVLPHFIPKTFKKHQIVVHQDDLVKYNFFILKGLMKSARITSDGKEHIMQFAMENWWITDLEAFHNGTNSKFTIDCLEDTTTYVITLESKLKLCQELPKMEHFFHVKTTAGYIALQKRVLCFISSKAQDRYHNLLEQDPMLIQRVPKVMIASFLGVSRETLSRFTP